MSQNLTPMKELGFSSDNDLGMPPEVQFSGADLFSGTGDLPTPDPQVVRLMVRRGQWVFMIVFVCSTVLMPLTLFGVGSFVLWFTGSPLCGSIGHLVIEGDECGDQITWEFWLGLVCIFLVFAFMSLEVSQLFLRAPNARKMREDRRMKAQKEG